MNNEKDPLLNGWRGIKGFFLAPIAASDFDSSVVRSDLVARRLGFAVLTVFFLGFGAWAVFVPLESAARAPGTVQVEGDRKSVQHLEGGLVAEIFVASGDYVEKGDKLIRLDSTRAEAERRITEGRRWAKRAEVDRLISERDGLPSIDVTPNLLEISDERAVEALKSEVAIFDARASSRLGEIQVIHQKIKQLEGQIAGAELVKSAKSAVAESLRLEIEDLKMLLEEGYVDRQRIRQLERSLSQTFAELAEITSQISAARVSVQEMQLHEIQIEKNFQMQVVEKLTQSQEEYYDLSQRLQAINDQVERTTVRSPASGYVLAVKPNTVGAVIGSGDELMAVVPDVGSLVIDAKVSPMDIDRISIGQKAEVRFAVFKDSYSVSGSLVRVSADALTDEETGEDFFEAKIALREEDLELLEGYQLVPGMPADVLIKTGERTLMGYLTSPLKRMFENALIED